MNKIVENTNSLIDEEVIDISKIMDGLLNKLNQYEKNKRIENKRLHGKMEIKEDEKELKPKKVAKEK